MWMDCHAGHCISVTFFRPISTSVRGSLCPAPTGATPRRFRGRRWRCTCRSCAPQPPWIAPLRRPAASSRSVHTQSWWSSRLRHTQTWWSSRSVHTQTWWISRSVHTQTWWSSRSVLTKSWWNSRSVRTQTWWSSRSVHTQTSWITRGRKQRKLIWKCSCTYTFICTCVNITVAPW